MNCLRGLPLPYTVKGDSFSAWVSYITTIRGTDIITCRSDKIITIVTEILHTHTMISPVDVLAHVWRYSTCESVQGSHDCPPG